MLEFLAVALGGYVLGIIVMMVIRANTMEENECVTLGVLIAAIMLGFVHLFGIIFSFIGEFNMAELAGLELLLFVFGKIEFAIMGVIYPQCDVILDLTQYFQWKYLLAVIIGMTIVELFAGAVILRFGMKALWGIWAVWMFIMLVPVKLSENEMIAAKMHQIGMQIGFGNIAQYLFLLGVVVAAIMAVLAWKLLRKQKVTV